MTFGLKSRQTLSPFKVRTSQSAILIQRDNWFQKEFELPIRGDAVAHQHCPRDSDKAYIG
jgi:hypothetical protein